MVARAGVGGDGKGGGKGKCGGRVAVQALVWARPNSDGHRVGGRAGECE